MISHVDQHNNYSCLVSLVSRLCVQTNESGVLGLAADGKRVNFTK